MKDTGKGLVDRYPGIYTQLKDTREGLIEIFRGISTQWNDTGWGLVKRYWRIPTQVKDPVGLVEIYPGLLRCRRLIGLC